MYLTRILWTAAVLAGAALAVPKSFLYPHGRGVPDELLPPQDDVSSPEIFLKTPIVFYDEQYYSIYINSNGILSFLTEISTFFNIQFPLDYPVIAPLYSNVDIRGSGSVYYRESQEPEVLERATETVRNAFSDARDFQARSVLLVTWEDVGYHKQGRDRVNTFQVAVITSGHDSYAEFLYPEDGIQWIRGSMSTSGLPDAFAQAGFMSGDGRILTLKGSGTDQVLNLNQWSNIGNPGQWIFRIGRIGAEGNAKGPDVAVEEEMPKSCVKGTYLCHSRAICNTYTDGFCCTCQPGYYGNGFNCLSDEQPVRVNGKVSGVINGINFTDFDLQAYVVPKDGRSYTALSRVPINVGYDMQSLNILGTTIGWLFAKPMKGAMNGYQITGGVFNQTATITYPQTGHQLVLRQKFTGLDVFQQLQMSADIKGDVPNIPIGSKIIIKDYDEQYTKLGPGSLLAVSTLIFQLEGVMIDNTYRIEQNIQYSECEQSPVAESPFKLRVARNYIGYEEENIIRYAMNNKVTPIGVDEDPCREGKSQCGRYSTCLAEGDTFRCVCNPGYQYVTGESGGICVDTDECATGTHNCDANALCINNQGSFYCRCNPGFVGDGTSCSRETTCQDLRCDYNADCLERYRGSPQCFCRPGFEGNGTYCFRTDDSRPKEYPDYQTPPPSPPPESEHRPEEEPDVIPRCILGICYCPDGYEIDDSVRKCLKKMEGSPAEGDDREREDRQRYPQQPNYPQPVPLDADRTREQYPHPDGDRRPQHPYDGDRRYESQYPDGNRRHDMMPPHQYPPSEGDRRDEIHYPQPEGDRRHEMPPHHYPQPESDRRHEMPPHQYPDNEEISCNVLNRCHPHAQCVPSPQTGSYHCECNVGYHGDGMECNPIDGIFQYEQDECLSSIDCVGEGECIFDPTVQKNTCVCQSGFTKDPVTRTCVEDALEDPRGNYCLDHNECHPDAECKFSDPRSRYGECMCRQGFEGDGRRNCRPADIGCNILNNCAPGTAECKYDGNARGYRCQCRPGYVGDGIICNALRTCADDPSLCGEHAECMPSQLGGYSCQCREGYIGNGLMCKPVGEKIGNFLLLNQGNAMLRVPFKPTSGDPAKPIMMQVLQQSIGIDIDCNEGRVYWSDIAGKKIESSTFKGTDIKKFITEDIGSVEGVSVDWLSRNIYWTDSTKDTIEVANLDNSQLRKVLASEGLVNPRGIAVHPSRGKVFWSDWNRAAPKIEWANMDGTGREIFRHGPKVQLPNSLAIDFLTDELCWADAGTKTIECTGIGNRYDRTIAKNLSYPFGLAISQDHYYWTDWTTRKIERATRPAQVMEKPLSVPIVGSSKLYGIVAVPDFCPRVSNICQNDNGRCPENHLCLPDGTGGRSCVCGKDAC
ncbi:UNVERIFIED_CONTAM: hypothetical protein PYX00_009108 [Menopon gallinae]|uniref:Nidogen n=1 Tax=Menopon gallinae TaxID=328185 RepID=A0AAW2HA20_9NEOP